MKPTTPSLRLPAPPARLARFAVAAALLAALGTVARANILDLLAPKHDVQVITVTDTTPVGRLMRAATPQNPVYYIAVNLGYHDLGGIIAGDKVPSKQEMLNTIAHVLAKEGYLPATDAHPPTLVLLWMWGTMNTNRMGTGSDAFPDLQTNRSQILRFLGGYKVGLMSKDPQPFPEDFMPGLSVHSANAQALYDLSTEDMYVAAIGAYDYSAFLHKQKQLLWTTKISCPARGLQMDETLPTMLALAGPNIGRETPAPVLVNASDKYKPQVQIGDAKVVEYLEHAPLPVIDGNQKKKK